MSCNGICKKYKTKKIAKKTWYELGVRCQICEIFIFYEGTVNGFCKCCNYRVRTKPRSRVGRQKLRNQKIPQPIDVR